MHFEGFLNGLDVGWDEDEKVVKDDSKCLGVGARRMHSLSTGRLGEVLGRRSGVRWGKVEFKMHIRHSHVIQSRQSDTCNSGFGREV